jgi:hypothetical protein
MAIHARSETSIAGFVVNGEQHRVIHSAAYWDKPPREGQPKPKLHPAAGRIEKRDGDDSWLTVCSFVYGQNGTLNIPSDVLAALIGSVRLG